MINFIKFNSFIIRPSLLILMGMVLSCAWIGSAPVQTRSPSEDKVVTDHPDPLQEAYSNYAMAAIHMSHGRHEKALNYLFAALENDPDSIFLNRKMAEFQKGKLAYGEAVKYARKAIDLDPKNIRNRELLAGIYSASGDEEAAIKEYTGILDFVPKNQRVRLLLITVLIREDQFKPALSHLNILVEQAPEMIIAHYYKGRVNFEMGNYQEAEKAYLNTLRINKRMEPALFDLGSLYQMGKKYQKALEIYEKLIAFYPANIIVRERLISILYKLGQEEKAEKQMEEIKKQSKPGDPGRKTLGLIYLRHGKLDESIAELDMIVSAWPEDYKARYYLASAYEEKEAQGKALDHFRLIKEGTTYFIDAQMHIAYILNVLDKHEEAIDILQKAIRFDNKKSELYLMLSSIFEEKKDYAKALEVIKTGLTYDDKNIELMFRFGIILDKSGDKEKSLERMSKILDIKPDHADALNYIGYSYADEGIRLDEALSLIQKALKIKPNSGYIIDSLGWVYYKKGMYDEALVSLKKAVFLTPDDPTITEHIGDVYYKKEEYQKALEEYQKALRLNHPQKEKLRKRIKELIKKVSEVSGQ